MTAHLEKMGAWLAGLRWEHIPESARRAARLELLDLVAAVHAAARDGEADRLLTNLPFGAGPSTVIATGARHAPGDAAFLNAAYSMAQDFDSILWMGHTAHSAVWGALAVAEAERADGRALITAIVAANEIGGRLGASSFLGPLNGQMWTFIHLVGAAAAAASVLRLDATRAAHALAISLAQPTFALQPAFFGVTSKLLAAATPTQIGLQAAYLARNGMTGALDILEDRRGFWNVFTFEPLPEMLDGLGELWATDTLELKTSPACHYFQTACEATARMVAHRRPDVDQVTRITVATTKLGDEAMRFAREYAGANVPDLSPIGASFDLGLAVAIVLVAGQMTGEESSPAWLDAHAAELRAWYAKIDVVHDPALTMRVLDGARAIPAGRAAITGLGAGDWLHLVRSYRAHYGSSLLRVKEAVGWVRAALGEKRPAPEPGLPLYFPNRVTIEHRDGSRDELQLDLPAGSVAGRDVDRVLATKLRRELGARLGAGRADAALATGLAVEERGIDALVASITGKQS